MVLFLKNSRQEVNIQSAVSYFINRAFLVMITVFYIPKCVECSKDLSKEALKAIIPFYSD